MRIFSKKRGNIIEMVLNPLFHVLIAFGIILLLLNYTTSVGKSSYYEREFLSRNTGLMIEALQAAPNNVTAKYTLSTHGLILSFEKDKVVAYPHDVDPETSNVKVSAYPIIPSSLKIDENILKPNIITGAKGKEVPFPFKLSFQKTSERIIPTTEGYSPKHEEQKEANCIFVNTLDEVWADQKKVLIDVIDVGKQGATKDNILSSTFAAGICGSLTLGTSDKAFLPINSDCKTLGMSIDDHIKKIENLNPDLLIILFVNTNNETENTLKIYYVGDGADKNKEIKLACQIISKLLDADIKYTSAQKIGGLPPYLSHISSVLKGRTSILIDVGNINHLQNKDIKQISEALHDAVKTYYTS
ncbi:hypothetical protein GOV08_05160 [Candidatus Woesearchaeota archaeon]|nr:hypothetical protein [Candidatus Woesearchaeota archaeon]